MGLIPGDCVAKKTCFQARIRDAANDHARSLPNHSGVTVMSSSFKGKVAFVTGAGMGMGLATAEAFAEQGAAVVLADVNYNAVAAAVDRITAAGGQALALQCDVSDEAAVKAAVEKTVEVFGRLDAAFNNAGIQTPSADTADALSEEYDRTMAVNLRGVWNCMKYELQQMRRQGSGAIVNCSSLGGLVGLPNRAIYHAAKHGVIGLTKSSALEYAARGVRINAVCPGIIDTPMVAKMFEVGELKMSDVASVQPIGRLGRADEIASLVTFLCGPGSEFIIGQSIAIDGGYTVP
jgi:NAD(P)-dependent dehydrogenase (short-subunit alcohol dehydrogenase family)